MDHELVFYRITMDGNVEQGIIWEDLHSVKLTFVKLVKTMQFHHREEVRVALVK